MKPTVTIGIPAHNEEKNIGTLLSALVGQKAENFILQHIIVVCDGCTDNTATVVRKMAKQYPKISVIDDGKRLGKTKRMNDFYNNLQSDIFVSFDADIRIQGDTVSRLVEPFTNKQVGLVGGRVSVQKQKKFIGKILEAQEYFWTCVVASLHNGNNLQSYTGPVSAGSKVFFKTIKRPTNIIADDQFLYFSAIKNGFLYEPIKNLQVFINVPTTFNDYMRQSTRFLSSPSQLRDHFGNWIDTHYEIAYDKKLKAYMHAIEKYPLHMPLAIILVSLQKLLSPFYREKSAHGTWTPIQSTKSYV